LPLKAAGLNGKNFQAQQLVPKSQNAIQIFRVDVPAQDQPGAINNGFVALGAGRGALKKSREASHALFERRGTFRCLKKLT
jgi:hypothetical protein